jgi:uncharacterized protein (DUF1501 family)
MLTRRRFIAQGVAFGAAAFALPRFALAAKDTDRRFVFVIQRGAMDGLAAVPPFADPDYRELRGSLALPSPGTPDGILDLNGFFGLNPALQPFQRYWHSRQLLVLHAVATPYRDRSHFDGQDVLENGATSSLSRQDGWLNRAVALYGGDSAKFALAAGQQVPLVLRGKAEVGSWAPARIKQLPDGFVRALAASYGQDKLFRMALEDGVQENAFVEATLGDQMQKPLPAPMGDQAQKVKADRAFVDMATNVGKLLAAQEGPRVAVLEIGGWDTHVGQGTTTGRLANALATLSEGLGSLSQAMTPVWGKTVIMTSTEFGRTARPNGTGGTDHGTASAAFLLGGAVNGGRVLANWPGIGSGRLYQNRDLAPTIDLRAVFKAVLKEHMGLPESDLDRTVFPESSPVQPLEGIVAA